MSTSARRARWPSAGLFGADQHAIGRLEILDGAALGEELGIGEDLEAQPAGIRIEDSRHRFRGAHRQRRFFDDDLPVVGFFEDLTGGLLPVLQVRGTPGALPEQLGRRVDRDEDDVGGADAAGHVGREEQIPAARAAHHLVQPGLEDRQPVAVPGADPFGIDVGHGDPHMGTAICDDRHGRTADVAGADAEHVGR